MAKKYYWLQLKEDFFRQKEIKMLRKIAGGDTYTIIYQKMLLMSLKDDGKIFYEGIGNSFAEEIALEIDEEIENVQITINYLMTKNLMKSDSEDGVFMNDVPNLIGSESDSAKRVRRHRQIKKEEQKALQSNGDVTSGNTEIEIEIELEKELELEKEKNIVQQAEPAPFKEVIEYLNEKTGKQYRSSTKSNQAIIKARFKEGFSLEDFKTVIDNKVADWLKDTKMSEYLRPKTLFGADKFEGYLNQVSKAKKKPAADRYDLKHLTGRSGNVEGHATNTREANEDYEDDLPF